MRSLGKNPINTYTGGLFQLPPIPIKPVVEMTETKEEDLDILAQLADLKELLTSFGFSFLKNMGKDQLQITWPDKKMTMYFPLTTPDEEILAVYKDLKNEYLVILQGEEVKKNSVSSQATAMVQAAKALGFRFSFNGPSYVILYPIDYSKADKFCCNLPKTTSPELLIEILGGCLKKYKEDKEDSMAKEKEINLEEFPNRPKNDNITRAILMNFRDKPASIKFLPPSECVLNDYLIEDLKEQSGAIIVGDTLYYWVIDNEDLEDVLYCYLLNSIKEDPEILKLSTLAEHLDLSAYQAENKKFFEVQDLESAADLIAYLHHAHYSRKMIIQEMLPFIDMEDMVKNLVYANDIYYFLGVHQDKTTQIVYSVGDSPEDVITIILYNVLDIHLGIYASDKLKAQDTQDAALGVIACF